MLIRSITPVHLRSAAIVWCCLLTCSVLNAQPWRQGYEVDKRKNGNGIVEERGKYLLGYSYGLPDTSRNDSITAIVEYKNHKRNGRRIQFFHYPDDTASVEHFTNDTLNGPFYYNHTNGATWMRGHYVKGRFETQPEYYGEDGKKINENLTSDTVAGLYYLDGKLCEGRYSIYGFGGLNTGHVTDDVWFTHGKIDSVYSYRWAYWGKSSEIHRNYIDSSRVYWNYNNKGLPMWRYSGKITGITGRIRSDGWHLQFYDADKIVMHGEQVDYHNGTSVISTRSYYYLGEKTGEWKFYDVNGELIRTQKY